MDGRRNHWYIWNMRTLSDRHIPNFDLYGEASPFPDVLHVERIVDRAAAHDWSIAVHRHPNLHQLFLIETGGGHVQLDGDRHALHPRQMVSIPPMTVHGFQFDQGTRGWVLTLPVAEFADVLTGDGPLAAPLARWGRVDLTEAIQTHVARLAGEHAAQDAFRIPALRAQAIDLLCQVARALPAPEDTAPPTRPDIMARFDDLLRAGLRERRTVADYAADLAITPTHLNRVIRAATGLSAARYVEGQMIQEARRQLAYTRLSVAEIGYRMGFEDPAYFSRVFRRHTGERPTEYRQRLRH